MEKAENNTLNIEERAEYAAQLKLSGRRNCCQAVTAALSDETGLSEEQLSQIAAGFCAGMGNMEATCGALVGAGIIAGLKTGGDGTLKKTNQISGRFNEMCGGAITCRELKGIDRDRVLCPCEDCVRNAVRAYGEVMGVSAQ